MLLQLYGVGYVNWCHTVDYDCSQVWEHTWVAPLHISLKYVNLLGFTSQVQIAGEVDVAC